MNTTVNQTERVSMAMQRFLAFYREFNQQSIEKLDNYYHPNIEFSDPLHKVKGLVNLERYFWGMSQQLLWCEFEFSTPLISGDCLAVEWVMRYRHNKLRSGRLLTMTGTSHLKFLDDKVIRHKDYFDAGAMIYEHLPILGGIIRFIRRRAQGDTTSMKRLFRRNQRQPANLSR